MDSASLIGIVIGVVGALLGVYYRESMRRAHRTQVLATKLEAQINELFHEFVLGDFSDVLAIASVWNDERQEALRKRGKEGFFEVEKKYKNRLKEMREALTTGSESIDQKVRDLHQQYRVMPASVFEHSIGQLDKGWEAISEGRGLLSEDEAAELSWDSAARISALRSNMLKVITKSTALILTLREMTDLDIPRVRGLIPPILEDCIHLSLQIEPLRNRAEAMRKRPVWSLAWQHMLHGS